MKIIINKEPIACPRPRVSKFGVYYPKKYQDYKDYLKYYLTSLNLNKFEDKPLYLNIVSVKLITLFVFIVYFF